MQAKVAYGIEDVNNEKMITAIEDMYHGSEQQKRGQLLSSEEAAG